MPELRFELEASRDYQAYEEKFRARSPHILLPNPWLSAIGGGDAKIVWQKNGGSAPEEIVVTSPPLYALEADTFARALMGGWRDVPAMPVADTLGNMATLDRWREAIGLVYDVEKRVF